MALPGEKKTPPREDYNASSGLGDPNPVQNCPGAIYDTPDSILKSFLKRFPEYVTGKCSKEEMMSLFYYQKGELRNAVDSILQYYKDKFASFEVNDIEILGVHDTDNTDFYFKYKGMIDWADTSPSRKRIDVGYTYQAKIKKGNPSDKDDTRRCKFHFYAKKIEEGWFLVPGSWEECDGGRSGLAIKVWKY